MYVKSHQFYLTKGEELFLKIMILITFYSRMFFKDSIRIRAAYLTWKKFLLFVEILTC